MNPLKALLAAPPENYHLPPITYALPMRQIQEVQVGSDRYAANGVGDVAVGHDLVSIQQGTHVPGMNRRIFLIEPHPYCISFVSSQCLFYC